MIRGTSRVTPPPGTRGGPLEVLRASERHPGIAMLFEVNGHLDPYLPVPEAVAVRAASSPSTGSASEITKRMSSLRS